MYADATIDTPGVTPVAATAPAVAPNRLGDETNYSRWPSEEVATCSQDLYFARAQAPQHRLRLRHLAVRV